MHLVIPEFSFATNTPTANNIAQLILDAWAEGPGSPLLKRDPNGLPTASRREEPCRKLHGGSMQRGSI